MSCPEFLETERLILRRWRPEDLAPFAAMNADPRVMEHFPKLLTLDESDAFAQRIINRFAESGYGLWAVEVKGGDSFIGFVGLSYMDFEAAFTPCVEVGWRLAADYWGKGFAPEAARKALRDGFERLKLDEIIAITAVCNSNSRRVMEKLNMIHEPAENFDHPRVPEGHHIRPHVLYRITNELFDRMRR